MTSAPNAPVAIGPYVRVRDVAAALGVDRRTIWAWVQAGKFPQPLRMTERGNSFWPADVLTEFLKAKREQARKEVET